MKNVKHEAVKRQDSWNVFLIQMFILYMYLYMYP